MENATERSQSRYFANTFFVTFATIGFIASVLSLVSFAQQVFALEFKAILSQLLEYYEHVLDRVFSPVEPLLRALGRILHVDLDLQPHWRSMLVLSWLYVGADARLELDPKRNRKASFVFAALFGGTLGLLASIISGQYAIEDRSNLAVWVPIGAFVLYEIVRAVETAIWYPQPGKSRVFALRHHLWRFAFANAVCGLIAYFVGEAIIQTGFAESGLLIFLLFIVLLTGRNLAQPMMFVLRKGFADFWNRYASLATARLGLVVAAIIVAAICTIALDAWL